MTVATPDLDLGGDFATWEQQLDAPGCMWEGCSASAMWIVRGHFHTREQCVPAVTLCDPHFADVRNQLLVLALAGAARCGRCGFVATSALYRWERL